MVDIATATQEILSEPPAVEMKSGLEPPPSSMEPTVYSASVNTSTDLFEGELGEYELNEIPSLFNLDAQQMSPDLETLVVNAAAEDDLPFINNSNTGSEAVPPTTTSIDMNNNVNPNHKRAIAEISEDDNDSHSTSTTTSHNQESNKKLATLSATATSTQATVTSSNPPAVALLAPKPSATPASVPSAAISATKPKPPPTSTIVTKSRRSKRPPPPPTDRKIDTSTAHVKALTSSKGAAMCVDVVVGTTAATIPTNLSPEEKLQYSKDRNRLHARNTRIRKKAYVDELKRTFEQLTKEQQAATAAKQQKIEIQKEEREVRFRVMEEFLRLRGINEPNAATWNAILEDGITLQLPQVSFGQGTTKSLCSGVTEIMRECHEFSERVQHQLPQATLTYHCDRESLLMEESNVVMDWIATAANPLSNFHMRGTFRASFNPQSNRMHSIDLCFDSAPLLPKVA